MSPRAGDMLLRQVRPIIRAALAKGAVRTVGSEDLQELEADAVAQAANMLDSAELAGKEVRPNSVAYYVLQALRSGRRSGYAGRADALSPAAALDGRVTVLSMDEPFGYADDDENEELNLHACLAATGEDPAAQGSRELDWDSALAGLGQEDADIVLATAAGTPGLTWGCATACPRPASASASARSAAGSGRRSGTPCSPTASARDRVAGRHAGVQREAGVQVRSVT